MVNFKEGMQEKQEVPAFSIRNRYEAETRVGTPWITTRSHAKIALSGHSLDIAENTSSVSAMGVFHMLSGANEQTARYSVHFPLNQPNLKSADGKQKKCSQLIHDKEDDKNATTGRVDDFSYAAAQEICFVNKGVLLDKPDRPENSSKETLIMKLWETLGPVPSPAKHFVNSKFIEMGSNDMKQEYADKYDAPSKPGQSSDTIEADSENPAQSFIRPLSHSVTRKRVRARVYPENLGNKQPTPAMVHPKTLRNRQSCNYKVKHQKKNALSFEEKWFSVGPDAVTVGPLITKRNSDMKSCVIMTRNTLFPEKSVGSIQEAKVIGKSLLPAEIKSLEAVTLTKVKDSRCSIVMKDQLGELGGHTSPENADEMEQYHGQSPRNNANPCDNFRTPLFTMKTTADRSPFSSLPQVNEMEHQVHGPEQAQRKFSVRDACRFKSRLTGTQYTSATNLRSVSSVSSSFWVFGGERPDCMHFNSIWLTTRPFCLFFPIQLFQDDRTGLNGSSTTTPVQSASKKMQKMCYLLLRDGNWTAKRKKSNFFWVALVEVRCILEVVVMVDGLCGKVACDGRLLSLSHGSGAFGGGVIWSGSDWGLVEVATGSAEDIFSKIFPVDKPKLCRNKLLHCHEGVEYTESSPTLWSPKVNGRSGGILKESSEQNQEDGLARVVALFVSSVERVKSKMMSVTRNRCSDILIDAAEEIHQQVEIVESQILTDITKLTNLSKSRRKHLETKFQEQQEQLKLIHEKFKEEINQHLQDCKTTVEGLEAQQIEMRGAIERQSKILNVTELHLAAEMSGLLQRSGLFSFVADGQTEDAMVENRNCGMPERWHQHMTWCVL
ncbi:hypothetical protein Nepgr_011736 [Nepenthes gracilis]|uniref:Meiosis-specific protein ASY3-like coiled-coil domain-containing protein n=1 Tax=Nepenthes gracilis TaxID=150966 RepID=A0AAD3SFM4_NEPGR|nr:hypothetical protein Nepgr_011736 [Nepenthes gracilis]